jgi:predicted peptidase
MASDLSSPPLRRLVGRGFKFLSGAIFVVLTLSCCCMLPRETGFLDRAVTLENTQYPYIVYVPREYTPTKAWPVVLFLHGSGERGNDGLRATQIGAGAAIRSAPERVPAIVVFPQAPADSRWLEEPADAAMAALDHVQREFHCDPRRVYLTGLSMGGYGTWHLAMAHPERWAALVVVCGGLLPHPTTTAVRQSPLNAGAADPYAFTAHAVRNLPVWIFHGTDDPVIPVDESRHMRDSLVQEQDPDVRYSEYPGVGHNAWEKSYGDPAMWTWLFSQRRRL